LNFGLISDSNRSTNPVKVLMPTRGTANKSRSIASLGKPFAPWGESLFSFFTTGRRSRAEKIGVIFLLILIPSNL
jgi:hypothetical protein